ncbi:RrF2 family transcriptional regulator [Cedecea davisae]|uniref:RrF2 family transcriptional regulator n=1 Tax=Cedecea davisae TaxID=158484 RepID=UPI001D0BB2A9|nr:Rrf2 family transcriptional regulator [Cedecea davisae]
MRISSRHDVALAFLLEIENVSKPVASIAASTGSSLSNMEHTARALRQAGIIESLRGKDGGYTLMRPLNEITVDDLFQAIGTDTKRRGYGLFDEIHRRLKDVALSEFAAKARQ